MTQHYDLLQRNLLCTAMNRGKKLVVIERSKKALAIAVKNNRTVKRYTHLRGEVERPETARSWEFGDGS